jgi:alkylhydroperoxidase/carboxymuconolactone decarboxylase family protein
MKLDRTKWEDALRFFGECRLLTAPEREEVLGLFSAEYPFGAALRLADSVHLHLKVESVARLPHDRITALGVRAENARPGYIKYPFPGGLNLIFSDIPIAQDDLLPDAHRRARPFLDHYGIDLRQETTEVRAAFDAVPGLARAGGWRHVQQGGPGQPVYCCHVEVGVKHWAYPAAGRWTRPVEFAYGPLKIHPGTDMGCDLRPVDPAHPQAALAQACALPKAAPAAGPSYYDPRDLPHFGDLAALAEPQMQRFFDYLASATGEEGALTRKEKVLMALAVAHARHCPYSIDTFVSQCLEAGVHPRQMQEAVHVAASVGALTDLAHSLQLRSALKAKGLL